MIEINGCLLGLALLLAATPDTPLVQEPDRVDEIVVTGAPGGTEPYLAPYAVTEVPGIGSGAVTPPRTASAALESLPQVLNQKTSVGQSSPFLRGFTGFRTLILIDGIRLNNASFRDGPNQYAALVDPAIVERAELVTGPGSILYGSDAVGGTIQYLTREPQFSADGSETVISTAHRYGSADDSWVARVAAEARGERFAVRIGSSYRTFDDLSGGRHNGTFGNTGYDEWAGDFKSVLRVNAETEITVAYQRHQQLDVPRTHSTIFAVPYRGTTVGSDLRRDLRETRELLYARARWQPSAIETLEVTVARHLIDELERRVRSNGRKRDQGFSDAMGIIQARYQRQTNIGEITSGVEFRYESVNSFFRERNVDGTLFAVNERGPVADDATYQSFDVYLQDRFQPCPQLTVQAGLRYSWVGVDADQVDPDLTDGDAFSSVNDDFGALIGSVQASAEVCEGVRVYGSAAQSFRAPNLSDLTRFDVARSGEQEIPSPDLDPERFLTLEVGSKLRHGPVAATIAYYYTFIDDLIVRFPTGGVSSDGDAIVTKSNAGDGWVTGVEVAAEVELCDDRWQLFGRLAWVTGEVTTPLSPTTESDEPISRLAPTTAVVGVRVRPAPEWLAELEIRIADDQDRLSPRDAADTQRIPIGGTPGYGVVNLRGSWRPRAGVRVFAAVENLTDRDYRIHGSGTNEPGISFVTGFELEF